MMRAMAAYLIVNVDVTDPVGYQDYVKAVPPTLAAYGGRYLVRGGRAESLEGSCVPKRVVVIEFESAERARAWWSSVEYAGAKAIRQATATTDLILVDGV
jgi:uncharacterized protein (DUF1330 family)